MEEDLPLFDDGEGLFKLRQRPGQVADQAISLAREIAADQGVDIERSSNINCEEIMIDTTNAIRDGII
jgi:hypothetical protein